MNLESGIIIVSCLLVLVTILFAIFVTIMLNRIEKLEQAVSDFDIWKDGSCHRVEDLEKDYRVISNTVDTLTDRMSEMSSAISMLCDLHKELLGSIKDTNQWKDSVEKGFGLLRNDVAELKDFMTWCENSYDFKVSHQMKEQHKSE